MADQYVALVSGLFGALAWAPADCSNCCMDAESSLAAPAALGKREKRYMELLSELTRLKLSLQDRSAYYDEPGPEHDASVPETSDFNALSQTGNEALRALRVQMGPAADLLSDNAITALEEMLGALWHTRESRLCTADYIRSSIVLVDAAYSAVLTEARRELVEAQGS